MSWHLDSKVTVAVIMGLILNSATGIWWASNLTTEVKNFSAAANKINAVEVRVIKLEAREELMLGTMGSLRIAITNINDTMTAIGKEQSRRTPLVNRIEDEYFSSPNRNHNQRK